MIKTTSHQFGGSWTEEKLERIRKYLKEYMKIFSKNPRAKYFRTIYVDAFAGTGYRDLPESNEPVGRLFDNFEEDAEVQGFLKGSAVIALKNQPPFSEYLFLEKNPKYAKELNLLKERYVHLDIQVHNDDANQFLQNWYQQTDWTKTRAVVFLDPYGMQVQWQTLEMIAKTQGIDLWLLFPLGQAVNRLLTRESLPDESQTTRLTELFGTSDWQSAFYRTEMVTDLFDTTEQTSKIANLEAIGKFFVERLSTIFKEVANNPRELKNSRGVPIYLLCFAAANPKGAPTAIRIASHILDH